MGSSGDYLSPNMDQGSSSANPDEGLREMEQWLDQPVSNNVAKSTATSTTPSPDAAKSTATSTTPVTKPTSTTESTTTTSTTPGFEATFAVAGLLAVTLAALRRRR
ncbi:MAG: PGF-CTERM sorting domain-containing protein [Methanothrix sp.]